MDYLKSFIIGTAGPVYLPHLALLSLADDDYYDYSFKTYSLLAPTYYGLMNTLGLWLGKTFELSLQQRLFLISIISIIFIVSLSYFVSSHFYKPYKNYATKDWLRYIILNGGRHLIAFNIIIYFFEKYFDKSFFVKVFVIGSSIISYLLTYLKVMWLDALGLTNYDFKTFAVFEPLIQGFDLLAYFFIFNYLLQFSIPATLIIWNILSSLMWLFLAYFNQTYTYVNVAEWATAFFRVIMTGFIKIIAIYYALVKL